MSNEERIEDDKMMQSEDRHAGCHIIGEAPNIRCEHLLTSSCGPVGTGAGTLTVLVETVVDVAVCVRVCVCVCVAVAVSCTVEVTVTGGSWPRPVFSLCCAPAKRPMKMELRSKNSNATTRSTFVSGVNGSCMIDVKDER